MYVISIDVGTKNLAYCMLEKNEQGNITIQNWSVCELPCVATNIPKVTGFLRSLLPIDKDITDVVIEKQPARNVKMRLMENTLTTFFVMLDVPRVVNYSSKHKLGNIGKTAKGKTNYSLRKKMGVAMCGTYLKDHNESQEYMSLFNASKKKDDLADCLLQGLSYMGFNINSLSDTCVCNV